METKVVNIYKDKYDVYIGRKGRNQDGYFGNPFPLKKGEERGSTIEKYKEYFYKRLKEDSEFKNKIESLKGKTLGCFCKPKTCHGDVIAEYLDRPFKILVCGSRDIRDWKFVFDKLDFLLSKKDLSSVIIIHGDQKSFDKHLEIYYGADYFAKLWAKSRNVKQIPFPAPWEGLPDTPKKLLKKSPYGDYWPGAGMYRNKQMLRENPDACVGFLKYRSANSGTKNMLKLCEDKGILTKKYYI